MTKEPWFKDGLRFTCTQCGNCCATVDPHTELAVHYTDAELQKLAGVLNLTTDQFEKQYTHLVEGERSLNSKPRGPGSSCVFLSEDNGCLVYEARPTQCRTWPFWKDNLTSQKAWQAAKADDSGCPGMDTGRLIPVSAIIKQRDR